VIRTAISACLALALLSLPAFAAEDKDKDKDKEKPNKVKSATYKTPEECFDAVVTAIGKRDAYLLIGAVTPKMQKEMAADLASQGVRMRAMAAGKTPRPLEKDSKDGKDKDDKDKARPDEKLAKEYKPFFDVMDRHGLTEKALKDVEAKDFGLTPKGRQEVLKLLDDPATFAADFMDAQGKADPRPKDKDKDAPKPKLVDLKVEGDKATAAVVLGDSKRKEAVAFEKVGGGWRIDPEPNRGKKAEGPKDKDGKDKPKKDGDKDRNDR